MAEQEYFKKALADFTFDAAAGGAIRHLADNGCTVKQIAEHLDFPVPEGRIARVVWEHFLATGRIRKEEPGNGTASEEYTYVTEYDNYGRKSFRRVKLAQRGAEKIVFHEVVFEPARYGKLSDYLAEKCAGNGVEKSYLSCDFAQNRKWEPEAFAAAMEVLEAREREYICGLFQEGGVVYHQLDRRMREIVVRLYEAGKYRGECWFLGSGEKVVLG